jgi:hypothetical protein
MRRRMERAKKRRVESEVRVEDAGSVGWLGMGKGLSRCGCVMATLSCPEVSWYIVYDSDTQL